jgi:hypothetical protein
MTDKSATVQPALTLADLERAVESAVKRAFRDVGIHSEHGDDVDQVRADFLFIRKLRRGSEGMAAKVGYTLITVAVTAALFIFTLGSKSWVSSAAGH